jgi:hypothetical protein
MTTMAKNVTGAGLAMSVALALAACGGGESMAGPGTKAPEMNGASVSCKESNSCKGTGSCAGVAVNDKHACKGQNSCGGNVRQISKEECDKIKGTVASK